MRLRNLFVLGSIALSLALPQLALSEDSIAGATKPQDKAKIDETTDHERNVIFSQQGAVQAPVASPPIKKADINSAIESLPTKKTQGSTVAKVKTAKPPFLTAVQKQKHEAGKVSSPVTAHTSVPSTSSHKLIETATTTSSPSKENQQNMLVKFSQADSGTVISARLDRSGNLPSYKVGDKMTVNVKANQDCNVVVFNYDSTGTLTQIYPNDYQPNGFVKSGEVVEIGGPDSPFDYQIAGKGGPEKVFVYAYPTGADSNNPITAMGPKVPKVAMAPIPGTPFRSVELTVDEYRKMVNSSAVFFPRSVEVKPRAPRAAMNVSSPASASTPNKVELTFTVEK